MASESRWYAGAGRPSSSKSLSAVLSSAGVEHEVDRDRRERERLTDPKTVRLLDKGIEDLLRPRERDCSSRSLSYEGSDVPEGVESEMERHRQRRTQDRGSSSLLR